MGILGGAIVLGAIILIFSVLGSIRVLGKSHLLPAAFRPAMPIAISTRPSALPGGGVVLQLINDTESHFIIKLDCENPTLSLKKTFKVELMPKHTTEFGGFDPGIEWKFVSGDQITVHHADYDDASAVVP